MPGHSKATIASMAVVTVVVSSLLHEGLGHGVTAWLRGDVVLTLTSNHLDSVRHDRLVDAGGTVANLVAGAICLFASGFARRVNTRYFLWFLGSVNLLLGAGYFLFSGVTGLGDWAHLIAGFSYIAPLRMVMALLGAAFYLYFVRLIAIALHPFAPRRGDYNIVARLPYLAACAFWCLAGAFDPLGFRLMLLSTIPASFGGMSGLLWADNLMPRAAPEEELVVERSPMWWAVAVVLGCAFLLTVARGIEFHHPQT